MLVVHPADIKTAVLCTLYKGTESIVVNQNMDKREIEHLLHHCPLHEKIMLLGHGHFYAHHLHHHNGNIIGIWSDADKFALKEGLHGLFSGSIIFNIKEAEEYGIVTLQHHIDETNEVMFAKLRRLLDEGMPFYKIPEQMKALNDKPSSWLARFNYENFHYL